MIDPSALMPETPSPSSPNVAETDFPALFLAADSASQRAQKRHLVFTGVILGALVVSAALGALASVFPGEAKSLALASTAGAALSFMLTAMRKALKPEKLWYGGRAVAESTKSLAWRYMTGADPYPLSLAPAEADAKFVSDLKAMVKDQAQAALGFGSDFSDRPQITARMREVRAATLEQRRQTYVSGRIADQRRWYGAKARKSQRVANWYFVLIQVSQALTLAATVLLLSATGSKWNLGGVFSALASALIAWLQVRQHEELAQSYSVTALDLGFIEEQAARVATEPELSAFVADGENTVSREHSLWIARRNTG
jgi:SMODS and SLOG-associating 2TM effector domain 3/SMODS and SLOG-associating 2TM effector domain 1